MIAQMMEATGISEKSVNVCQTTWHYNPKDKTSSFSPP
jgi:hypothetical protein